MNSRSNDVRDGMAVGDVGLALRLVGRARGLGATAAALLVYCGGIAVVSVGRDGAIEVFLYGVGVCAVVSTYVLARLAGAAVVRVTDTGHVHAAASPHLVPILATWAFPGGRSRLLVDGSNASTIGEEGDRDGR